MDNNIKDSQLIEDIQNGNIFSFELLVKKYEVRLLSFVYRIVYDNQEAEEIIQDTFFNVYKSINKIDDKRVFSHYLFEIAKNTAISCLRKRKKTIPLDESVSINDNERIYENLTRMELSNQLAGVLKRIGKKYERVLRLYYFDDLSYEEISKSLKIPINTVRTWLKRGKDAIKKEMDL